MTDLPPEDRSARAAEYVLRLLDRDEEAEFETAMLADPDLQSEVAGWVRHFESLNDEFEAVRPRRAVKTALMDRLFDEPVTAPASAPVRFWQRLWVWQGISLAALVLVAVVTVQSLLSGAGTPVVVSTYVAEIVAEDDSLRLLAVYDPGTGTLRLTRTAGAAPDGRVLELWAIRGDAAPVSLGVLPADASARVALPDAYRDADGLILAISEEPPGGSPTGAPTGAVLAVGQTHDI